MIGWRTDGERVFRTFITLEYSNLKLDGLVRKNNCADGLTNDTESTCYGM